MRRSLERRTSHGDGPPRRPKASPTTVTIASLHLCLCACAAVQPASAVAGEAGAMEHGMSLFRAWTAAYGLADDPRRSPLPPSPLALPANVPPAPHLEDCAQASFYRFIAEDRGGGGGGGEGEGGLPKWARHSPPATALLDPSRSALHRATPHLSAPAFPSHPPFSALHFLLPPPFFLPSPALPSVPLSAPSLLRAFCPTLLVPFFLCSERTTPPIALMPHPEHTAAPSSPSACPSLPSLPAAPPCAPLPPGGGMACALTPWHVPSPHGMCPHPIARALTPWHVPSPHGMADAATWLPGQAPAGRALARRLSLLPCTSAARNGGAARHRHAPQQNPRAASRNLPASQQPGVQRCVFASWAPLTAQPARVGGRHACGHKSPSHHPTFAWHDEGHLILILPSPSPPPSGALVTGTGCSFQFLLLILLRPPPPPSLLQVHWWRAQAVRFMLRWPSAHLCHVINQQRHTAYGIHVANHIASLPAIYASILQSVAATSAGPDAAQNLSLSAEASDLATLDLIPGSNPDPQPSASSMGAGLEARVWGARGFDRCSERCGGVGMGEYGRVGGEPLFVVRPMVGVVMGGSGGTGAGGGGGGEGRGGRGVLTSSGMGVGVHVMAASVLRLSDVDVRHMWVSWHAQVG
ncbi:unnamed protein product [Closterium sp. NIES-54]